MKNFVRKVKNVVIDQDKPISLIHFITNRCNARCDHCFIDFGNKDSQSAKISIENIEKLSKTFGEQLMNINLTGGYCKNLLSEYFHRFTFHHNTWWIH